MGLAKQDAIYAVLGGFVVSTITLAANGVLQNWVGLASAEGIYMLALIAAPLVCQHVLLLVVVELFKRQVQPALWLLSCSRPAIRAVLHLSAFSVLAIGILVGFQLGSNLLLTMSAGLAVTISVAAEWTFLGEFGPLATLLRTREREYVERANGS